MPPAIPPNESLDDLRAALRRNHPELSDDELEAILSGPPAERRPYVRANDNWYENKGKRTTSFGVTKRRQRGGWRGRKGVR